MTVQAAINFDDHTYETVKACSAEAGLSVEEWINNAARVAARRQHSTAYAAWESANHPDGLDDLDRASASRSLDGAEW